MIVEDDALPCHYIAVDLSNININLSSNKKTFPDCMLFEDLDQAIMACSMLG